MNIDSTVVFRYILPLYDHPIVCDWAKIGRKFAAFCRSHCSKLASAAAAKCRWASPPPKIVPKNVKNWEFIYLPGLDIEVTQGSSAVMSKHLKNQEIAVTGVLRIAVWGVEPVSCAHYSDGGLYSSFRIVDLLNKYLSNIPIFAVLFVNE